MNENLECKKPQKFFATSYYSNKIGVWVAINARRIMRPIFLESNNSILCYEEQK
jgi:hypothetical protein